MNDSIFCIVGISFWMSPFYELVVASSNLSSAHHSFCDQLLQTQSNNKSQMNKEHDVYELLKVTQECNYLYNYAMTNNLYFKLFGSELNAKAAMRLIILFCGAKFISYSIRNI